MKIDRLALALLLLSCLLIGTGIGLVAFRYGVIPMAFGVKYEELKPVHQEKVQPLFPSRPLRAKDSPLTQASTVQMVA